jgi:hypothetical protein
VGPHCLSKEDIGKLRADLYAMAEVVVSLIPGPDAREELQERAGIIEADGGLNRADAEREALIQNAHRKPRR